MSRASGPAHLHRAQSTRRPPPEPNMPSPIRRTTHFLASAIAFALAVPTPASLLHAQPATTARREGISLSLGSGWTELAGTASKGGVLGGGSFGVGYEVPLGSRVGLRLEGSINELRADLGETGIFSLPTTLSATRFGLGLHARRYSRGAAYVGAGFMVSSHSSCLVDTEGGPGFLGGATEECEEFPDLTLRSRSGVLGTVLTAGVQRGRWEYEVRYDQAVMTTIETEVGPLRGRSVAGVAHYRFGARPGPTAPPKPNDMRPAQPGPRFAHQAGISAAGFVLGVAAGAGIGALGASINDENDAYEQLGTGIFFGAVLGPALALHIDGARHGRRANFLVTVIGSFLGSAVGAIAAYGAPDAAIPIVLVSAPVAATLGYRLTDRAR
jgi:hypothetical protein